MRGDGRCGSGADNAGAADTGANHDDRSFKISRRGFYAANAILIANDLLGENTGLYLNPGAAAGDFKGGSKTADIDVSSLDQKGAREFF